MLAAYALQIYSYFGILDQAATTAGSTAKSKELTGGQHVDWLALSLLVQFGSVLHSKQWFWFLFLFPIGTLYSLYSAIKGGSGSAGAAADSNSNNYSNRGEATTEMAQEAKGGRLSRREKIAEKRRKQ